MGELGSKRAWAACALIALLTSGCAWVGRISVNNDGVQANGDSGFSELHQTAPAISPDGRYVAFDSAATNLVTGDTNNREDVFVRDAVAGTTIRASVNTLEFQANGSSAAPALSADGRYVAFVSDATNLVIGDTNGTRDVFVRDTIAGTTRRVSISNGGAQSDGFSYAAAISADGRYVVFYTSASLVAADTNDDTDVYVRDTVAETTRRVSISNEGAQGTGGEGSAGAAMSPDGRYVVFSSGETNLVAGDTNNQPDVFVRDTVAGTTTRVNVSSAEAESNHISSSAAISADGRYVAFGSLASNLVTPDTNNDYDIFVRDTVAGTTALASVQTNGTQSYADSGPSISADGRYVVFDSADPGLAGGDDNDGLVDVFVRDTVLGITSRVSAGPLGRPGNFESQYGAISGDGRYIAFSSAAQNLVSPDTNNWDVIVRAHPEPTVASVAPGTLPRGATTPVTVNGSYFFAGALIVIDGGGVTIGNITVVSETQITADATVAADAPVGARNVFVELPSTGPGPPIVTVGACGGCVTVT